MNKHALTALILILTLSTSCKTHRLSRQDKEWQPYRVGDTLIFESNRGEVDTIRVSKVESYINPTDYLNPFSDRYQTIFVMGKPSHIMDLSVGVGGAYVRFNLRLGKSKMRYPLMSMRVSDMRDSTDIVIFDGFKECLQITAVQQADNFKDLSFDLRYIYWSKELGYLGLEFKDDYIWVLKEFRRKGKNIIAK